MNPTSPSGSIELILASNSPRRRELLALAGWPFRVLAANVDETPLPAEPPAAYVLRLARLKAQTAARGLPAGALVLAADTTVADNGAILGKPVDALEAQSMLRRLRGRTHQVYTALAALRTADGLLLSELAATDVPMRPYTDEELQLYVASGDPLDKAGAYAIQHPGFHPVTGLSGCYANVVGLPLCHLLRMLRRLELAVSVDLPAACQEKMGYDCSIFKHILSVT